MIFRDFSRCQGQRRNVPGICLLFLLAALIGVVNWPVTSAGVVNAQSNEALLISPPDTTEFPLIEFTIKLPADIGDGAVILAPGQIRVIEDGTPRPVISVEQMQRGNYFVLVINGDGRLALRDFTGISLYDRIQERLINWVSDRTFQPEDQWSLIGGENFLIRNSSAPEQWTGTLADYQPDFRQMTPGTEGLELAIQTTQDHSLSFGVDKSILLITPPPIPAQIDTLNALAETARIAGIRVNVWMVGEDFFLTNDQGGALIRLAEKTGGQFFHLNPAEPIPNPEDYLANLGISHHIRYQSLLQSAGTYSLDVQADLSDSSYSGTSVPFYIEILPPRPILFSPPTSIIIPAQPSMSDGIQTEGDYSLAFNFIIEFPDGHPRELAASRLWVNDRVVVEQTSAPFDQLVWNLASVEEPGQYLVQVEVEDMLGLSARSVLTPVQVEQEVAVPVFQITYQQIALMIASVLVIGSLVLVILWVLNHPKNEELIQQIQTRFRIDTENIIEESGMIGQPEKIIQAALLPLNRIITDQEIDFFTISKDKVLIGCDPNQADLVISGRDIADVHAGLVVNNHQFWLYDLGTKGGSWVNYQRIGSGTQEIHPGDIIHFGKTGFRFTIQDENTISKVVVEKYEPIL